MGDIQTKGEQAVNIHVPVKVKKLNPVGGSADLRHAVCGGRRFICL